MAFDTRIARSLAVAAGAATLAWAGASGAAEALAADAFAKATARLEQRQGLLPVFVDRAAGKVLIVLPAPDKDGVSGRFIYQPILAAGIGSTPIGLDRAETTRAQVVAFHRVGRKVILQAENYGFRADGGTADEQRAVRDSFAVSNLWAGEVEAEAPNGGVLVDITSFLTRDAADVAERLKQRKQGAFKLTPALSYVDTASVGDFPENLEIEASETFASDEPSVELRSVAPDPHAVTLTVHHSFVKLPEPGFEPRLHDPRTGTSVQVLVNNYGSQLGDPVVYRLARRFRLEKIDPAAARSRVRKPIVFYVDRAAPDPIRSALVEGARWWAKAFEAAGFIDAFKVEVLPEGVNPMDSRYNVINWVHRQTRGWSTGQTIVDPRTGEIVRGVVQLGSLRVRQDLLIFQGLVGADQTGKGGADDPVRLSLARVRQLAMHETGHALGFSHNFAGSTYGDRASAMDYPAPVVRAKGDALSFSDAYKDGPGDWDRFTVKWLYSQFPKGVDERRALDAMARDAEDKGWRFIADTEHPYSTQWDNGTDPIAELDNVMAVRRLALNRFGLKNIPMGAPVSDLRRVIVPIYLFHRYQVEAAAKMIGGVDYSYAVRGDGHEAATPIPAATQRRALAVLMKTLSPGELDLPDRLIDLLSDGQSGTPDRQFELEVFPSMGGSVFDLPGAATTAADLTLSQLLDVERLNRMVELHRRDPAQLGVSEMMSQVFATAAPGAPGGEGRLAEIRRRVRMRLIGDVVDALNDRTLSPTAAGELRAALAAFGQQLSAFKGDADETMQAKALAKVLIDQNEAQLTRLASGRQPAAKAPPGAPIGEDCWFCALAAPL